MPGDRGLHTGPHALHIPVPPAPPLMEISAMERVVLRHLKGSKASQLEEFPLEQFAELTIGRDPSAGVRFDPDKDDLVGRQHARIARDANDPYRFTLTDLNSRNGTFLNKLRVVGDRPLQPGDVIQLGAGGPELQFDIDPLPAMYVKATRLGGAVAGVAETRVGAPPAASGSSASGGTGNAPAPTNSIGKATVERMIGETRNQGRRNMFAVLGVAAALIIGVVGYNRLQADKLEEQSGKTKARLDSLGKATGRAGELSKQLQPAEIAAALRRRGAVGFVCSRIAIRADGYHRPCPTSSRCGWVAPSDRVDNGRR